MYVEQQNLPILFRVWRCCVPQSTLVIWKRGMIPHLDEVTVWEVCQPDTITFHAISNMPLCFVLVVLILQLFDTDLHAVLCKDQILTFHLPLAVFSQIVCEDIHLLRRSESVSTTVLLWRGFKAEAIGRTYLISNVGKDGNNGEQND